MEADKNKELRIELKKKVQRISDLMRLCSIEYSNLINKSYRWNSLKNLKFKLQNESLPYELEYQKEYENSNTHKLLMNTKGLSGFDILLKS